MRIQQHDDSNTACSGVVVTTTPRHLEFITITARTQTRPGQDKTESGKANLLVTRCHVATGGEPPRCVMLSCPWRSMASLSMPSTRTRPPKAVSCCLIDVRNDVVDRGPTMNASPVSVRAPPKHPAFGGLATHKAGCALRQFRLVVGEVGANETRGSGGVNHMFALPPADRTCPTWSKGMHSVFAATLVAVRSSSASPLRYSCATGDQSSGVRNVRFTNVHSIVANITKSPRGSWF